MTDRDDARVRKALQGKDFPAERNDLVEPTPPTAARSTTPHSPRSRRCPRAATRTIDDVVASVPQRPGTTSNR